MISGAPKEQPETNDQEKIKAETSSRSVPIKFKKASSESQRFISVWSINNQDLFAKSYYIKKNITNVRLKRLTWLQNTNDQSAT